LDRHRIIQILVNLFRNAQDALADSERSNKVLKVQATPCGNDRVRISVTDNGIGVRPENLERLFEHGFTTKKGGHGFGLHSSANAAQAMGGSLTCHCNGETTFTLDLPFSPTQEGGKDEHDHSKRG
jgi:C4-dicarboxylate-specific signal transduction histidine kinase